MEIQKNNENIFINDVITKVQIEKDDHIKINEYIRYFEPKLSYGSLILIDEEKEIYIENITNVLNTTNAIVEFNDCLIDSMDELFELVKHSLGDEFSVDIEDIMDTEDDLLTLELINSAEELTHEEETQKIENDLSKDNKNLLIVLSTFDLDKILNFSFSYVNSTLQNNNWDKIHIMFWDKSIYCIKDNNEVKKQILNMKEKGIEFSYTLTSNNNDIKSDIQDLGINSFIGDELLTSTLKSSNWSVITV